MGLKIFAISRNARTYAELSKAVGGIEDITISGQYLEESENKLSHLLKMVNPDLILVDDTLVNVSPSSLVKELLLTNPLCGVIGLYHSANEEFNFDMTFDGRFSKIPKPIEVERLRYVIYLIMHNLMKSYISKKLPELKAGRTHCSKMLSFFAPKDGEGKTTIIVNLAHLLSQNYGQRVLLLNLNPIFDDTDVYLNFKSKQSMDQIFGRFNSPSANLDQIFGSIEEHPVYSNMFVISGTDFPVRLKEVRENPEFMELFLWYIESKFDWILVDTSSILDRTTFTILNLSANPFIVLQNHTISIRNIEIFLEIMKSCNLDSERFRFIATRISMTVGIKPSKLKTMFGTVDKFFSFIPSRGMLAIDSIVKRKPMVEIVDPQDDFYKVFDAMAHTLVGKEPDKQHKNVLMQSIKQFFNFKN